MASYGFHPEAAEEYLAATQYYLDLGAFGSTQSSLSDQQDRLEDHV